MAGVAAFRVMVYQALETALAEPPEAMAIAWKFVDAETVIGFEYRVDLFVGTEPFVV